MYSFLMVPTLDWFAVTLEELATSGDVVRRALAGMSRQRLTGREDSFPASWHTSTASLKDTRRI